MWDEYINGYIERKANGRYEGSMKIDGVSLSPIECVMFKKDNKNYLWLKRKPMLEYDDMTMAYRERPREPRWEAYLEKGVENDTVAYKGEFFFLRFRYSIVGVWDRVLGVDKQRMNFFVERLPMNYQTILNSINERKRKDEAR